MVSPARTTEEVRISAPELRGASLELGRCSDLEVVLDGPAGCIAGETRIYNPLTDEHIPVKELYEKKIAPTVQTLMGAVQAEIPFRKGVADLYRLTLASGRKCIVTRNHLLLSDNSWIFLSDCVPGTRLLISAPCPLPTTGVSGPSVSLQDALRLSQRPLNSQEHCFAYRHQCDERLPLTEDTAQVPVPSLSDVLLRSHADFYVDDRETLQAHSHLCQLSDRHARRYYAPLSADRAYTQYHSQRETVLLTCDLSQRGVRFQRVMPLHVSVAQQENDYDSTFHLARGSGECFCSSKDAVSAVVERRLLQQSRQCCPFVDMTPECLASEHLSGACNLSKCTPNTIIPVHKYHYMVQWDTVSSIEYVRTDEYFDLHVPIAEHYLAEGIWHHNTGKSFGALYKIHVLLTEFPGARALVSRKTNTALAGSAMVTYREEVLHPSENVRYFGGNRIRPAAFLYPNGSELVVNGLDKAEKVKSTAFDIALINEPTEVTLEDWEFVRSRLRHGKLPYHQLIGDVNPVEPTHWLNDRMNAGLTRRLLSRHEDNPRYYDIVARDWTPAGQEYIFGILGGLTGVRLARLRYGLWQAAEGTVYEDSWDRARNVIPRRDIPKSWPRYLAVDFGYTNPFVCIWAAQDPDGRLIIYRYIYKTKTLVEEHARQIAIASGWFHLLPRDHPRYQNRPADWADPLPRDIICDHDAEGRATLEAHLGLYTTPAKKAISEGIQAVTSRLRLAGDGIPRLQILENSLVERDGELARLKLPTTGEEEMEMYVWDTRQGQKKGELPVDAYNHFADALRYLVAYKDLGNGGVSYYKDIW